MMSRGGGRGASAPLAAAALTLMSLAAAPAHARSSVVVSYTTAEVWPAAIRFLRVDRNYRVREKDEPAGYVLFDLPENKRTYRAALEMVKTTDDEGRVATQITCTITDLPRRYETTLLDQLAAKVGEERGPPPPSAAGRRRSAAQRESTGSQAGAQARRRQSQPAAEAANLGPTAAVRRGDSPPRRRERQDPDD